MELKSDGITVRLASLKDAASLYRWWNDGEIMAHAGFPLGLGVSEEEIAEQIKRNSQENSLLIVELNEKPVGEMNYRFLNSKKAEIGIKICESVYQNRGAGSKALKLLIHYLFVERGCSKIVLDTNVQNLRAQHVYKKLGFAEAGRRMDCWKDQMGRLQSAVDFELLRKNYHER